MSSRGDLEAARDGLEDMRVNPNSDVPPRSNVPASKSGAPLPSSDSADLFRTTQLERALEDLPVVRPGKVEQARELIRDVSYPNDAMLERIAGTLGDHLKTEGSRK